MTLSSPTSVHSSGKHLPELEALRGLAIAMVFFHHAIAMVEGPWVITLGKLDVSVPRSFLVAGSTGVTLFFVLSAFLLALPFLAEAEGGKPVKRSLFYKRRALRILPLYWSCVLAVTLYTAGQLADMTRALPFLVFYGGYIVNALTPYSAVWWSLYTEVQFYALLPLLGLLRTRPARWVGLAGAAIYLAAYPAFLSADPSSIPAATHGLISHSLFGMAPIFGWGILAAWLYRRHGARIRDWANSSRLARGGGSDLLLLAILTGLGLVLQGLLARGLGMAELGLWHAWHVLEGFLWAAVVLVVVLAPLRTRPLFCNRVFERIGVLSYSIYLLHVPLLMHGFLHFRATGFVPASGWDGPTLGVLALLTAACVAMATVTYAIIERPFLVRKAHLATRTAE